MDAMSAIKFVSHTEFLVKNHNLLQLSFVEISKNIGIILTNHQHKLMSIQACNSIVTASRVRLVMLIYIELNP